MFKTKSDIETVEKGSFSKIHPRADTTTVTETHVTRVMLTFNRVPLWIEGEWIRIGFGIMEVPRSKSQ